MLVFFSILSLSTLCIDGDGEDDDRSFLRLHNLHKDDWVTRNFL